MGESENIIVQICNNVNNTCVFRLTGDNLCIGQADCLYKQKRINE